MHKSQMAQMEQYIAIARCLANQGWLFYAVLSEKLALPKDITCLIINEILALYFYRSIEFLYQKGNNLIRQVKWQGLMCNVDYLFHHIYAASPYPDGTIYRVQWERAIREGEIREPLLTYKFPLRTQDNVADMVYYTQERDDVIGIWINYKKTKKKKRTTATTTL